MYIGVLEVTISFYLYIYICNLKMTDNFFFKCSIF